MKTTTIERHSQSHVTPEILGAAKDSYWRYQDLMQIRRGIEMLRAAGFETTDDMRVHNNHQVAGAEVIYDESAQQVVNMLDAAGYPVRQMS